MFCGYTSLSEDAEPSRAAPTLDLIRFETLFGNQESQSFCPSSFSVLIPAVVDVDDVVVVVRAAASDVIANQASERARERPSARQYGRASLGGRQPRCRCRRWRLQQQIELKIIQIYGGCSSPAGFPLPRIMTAAATHKQCATRNETTRGLESGGKERHAAPLLGRRETISKHCCTIDKLLLLRSSSDDPQLFGERVEDLLG